MSFVPVYVLNFLYCFVRIEILQLSLTYFADYPYVTTFKIQNSLSAFSRKKNVIHIPNYANKKI